MKINALKRLVTEDFSEEDRELVGRLAYVLNPLIDNLLLIFDKRIDYINLNRQIKTISVTVGANGTPTTSIQIKSEVRGRVIGTKVIQAVAANQGVFTSGCPLISFTQDSGLINVNNIQGLPAGQNFTLTVEIIGENT